PMAKVGRSPAHPATATNARTPYFSNPNLTGLMRVHLTTTSYQNQAAYNREDSSFTAVSAHRNAYKLTERDGSAPSRRERIVFPPSSRLQSSNSSAFLTVRWRLPAPSTALLNASC